MKKLFGVVALATLPVACGTTLPSGPDIADAPGVSQEATSSSRRRVLPPPPPPPTCEPGVPDVIELSSPSDDATSVTVRATPIIRNSDRFTPCFEPSWSFQPEVKGAYLTISKDLLSATLVAPPGMYVVTATASAGSEEVTSSIKVIIE